MDERRQSLQPQFDRLAEIISENHQETIQRLTKIETYRNTDREDIKELQKQCGAHEKAYQRGKGILALFSVAGIGGAFEYIRTHWK